jgi:hypothetical protein
MRWSRLGLLLLIGCADPTSPQDDLYVAASLSSTSIGAGEPMTITVVVKNTGKRSHLLPEFFACFPPFEVTTPAGTAVAPASALCLFGGSSMSSMINLEPGGVYSRAFSWHGEGMGGEPWPSPAARFLAPGEYRLRPRVRSREGRIPARSIAIRIE